MLNLTIDRSIRIPIIRQYLPSN